MPRKPPKPTKDGSSIGAALFALPACTALGVLVPLLDWSFWAYIPVIGLGLMAAMEAGQELAKPCLGAITASDEVIHLRRNRPSAP